MRKVVGNSQYQKFANALLILRLLRKSSSTRVALSKALGLQPSTVTYIVGRLQESGLIRESLVSGSPEGRKSTASGRKAVKLELNRDFGRIIGLELLADSGWGSILDPMGHVIHSQKIEYPEACTTDLKDRFEFLVESSVAQMARMCEGIDILGVGIALPGIVESETHIVRECWTHALKECDFSRFLEENFAFPVILENDANCCVQRYLFESDEERAENIMYILARTYPSDHVPAGVSSFGIGIGLVFNGALYRGSSSRAGEFRSAMMAGSRIERQLAFELKDIDDLEQDREIRRRVLEEILMNTETISSVLDPQSVYLGGFLSDYTEEVKQLLSPETSQKTVFANAHTDASEGAAMNVLAQMFSIPQIGEQSSHWPWESLLKITE